MVVKSYNQTMLMAETTDRELLDIVQEYTDGDKVRGRDQILFPLRSIIHIPELVTTHVQYDERSRKILAAVRANVEIRARNIEKIKHQYGHCVLFNYEYKGIYQPMEHQKIIYCSIMHTDACAILAEPGTCKTGPYLWAIDKRIQDGQIKKTLIITLSDLKQNVLEEMKIQVPHMTGAILDNREQARKVLQKAYKSSKKNIDYNIYLMNYESAFSMFELFPDDYFDMIILDEAHRIGSPNTRQTKVITQKLEHSKFKYIVTGSLHANNLTSFFMPFRVLGPDVLPIANFYGFRRKYMYTVDPDQHIWRPAPGAIDEVKQIVGKVSVFFKKEDCLDLPGVIYEKRYCDMSGEQAEVYQTMRKELVAVITNMCSKCNHPGTCDMSCAETIEAKNALILSKKLHQIAAGFYINTRYEVDQITGAKTNISNVIDFKENPKLDLLMQVLNSIPSDRKVIIWTNYIHTVDLIIKRIEESYGPGLALTCYKNQNAYEMVQKFKDPAIRWMAGNPSKFGVGQNIQYSNYQVFFTVSYSYIQRDQAISRQDRQGQTEKVTVIDTMVRKSIDEIIYKNLMNKQDLGIKLSELARVI